MYVPRIFIFFVIKTFVPLVLASTHIFDSWINDANKNSAQVQIGAHWPNGIIPYVFDVKSYDLVIARRVRSIMKEIESVSCIRFKTMFAKPNMNVTWLHITNPRTERECMHEPRYNKNGEVLWLPSKLVSEKALEPYIKEVYNLPLCLAFMDYVNVFESTLVLGLDCLTEQQVLHTLMHGIGFKDEVTHPRRNHYIRILWNNIQPAYHHLFRIQMKDLSPRYTVEYDPMSVMHFHDRAYSVNGHETIAPVNSGFLINPSKDLSLLDKMKLHIVFGQECKKRNADDLLETCKRVFHEDVVKKLSSNNTGTKHNKMTKKVDIAVSNEKITGSTEVVSQNKGDKAFNKSNNNITVSSDSANEDNTDVNDDEKNYETEETPAHGASEISETDV